MTIEAVLGTIKADMEALPVSVIDGVVAQIVTRERDRRVALLVKGLDQLTVLDLEVLKSSKADVKTFDAEGKPLPEVFSPGALQNMNKAKAKQVKLVQALNTAIGSADFKPLEKFLKGGGDDKPEPPTE